MKEGYWSLRQRCDQHIRDLQHGRAKQYTETYLFRMGKELEELLKELEKELSVR